MPNCLVKRCSHRIRRGQELPQGLGFHRLPRDRKLRNAWFKAVGRSDLENSTTQFAICSDHFLEEDFKPSSYFKVELMGLKRKRCLKEGAVPSVNLGSPEELEFKRKRGRPKKKKPLEKTSNVTLDGEDGDGSGPSHSNQSSFFCLNDTSKDPIESCSSGKPSHSSTTTNQEPSPSLSSPSRLPFSCCQTVLVEGVDNLDGDQSIFMKHESWDDVHTVQPEPVLQDEPSQDHMMRSTVHCPDYMECVKVELTDPTDLMMLSHARRIRGFTRKRQVQLGMRIAQLVMEAELEEIAEDEASSSNAQSQVQTQSQPWSETEESINRLDNS